MERRNTVLGIALCTAAFASSALSMGSLRGSAVIGQPLELSFDISLDPGADATSACAQAELYYGETRIDGSRFRVVTGAGNTPLQAVVRVLSSVAVNEPIVSVVLRAGCGQSLSRRYVVLAVAPSASDGAPGESTLSNPAGQPSGNANFSPFLPSQRRNVGNAVPLVSSSADPTAGLAADDRSPRIKVRPALPVRRPVPAPLPTTSTRSNEGRPRLELQSPADWLEELQLPLRYSNTMSPPVEATAEQRAAAVATWRSLNGETAAPVVGADDSQRLKVLEQQNKTLQESLARNRAREAELQTQLDAARRDGDLLQVLMWPLLAAFTLLMVLVVAWRVHARKGTTTAWWKPKTDYREVIVSRYDDADAADFVNTQPSEMALPRIFPRSEEPASSSGLLSAANERRNAEGKTEHATMPASASPAVFAAAIEKRVDLTSNEVATNASTVDGMRDLRSSSADDLLDLRQNAEFFISLGQYEQAIEALQQYISAHPGTSPLVYLDLLQIFHTLSLTDPYRKLREDFNAEFNASVPVFAAFMKPTKGLESYVDAIARIESAWAGVEVLDVIEAYLFKKSAGVLTSVGALPFELEAYKELLLLYEIAKSDRSVADLGGRVLGGSAESDGTIAGISERSLMANLESGLDDPSTVNFPQEYLPTFPLNAVPSSESAATSFNADGATAPTYEPLDFSELEEQLSSPATDHKNSSVEWLPTIEANTDIQGEPVKADVNASAPRDTNLIDFDVFDLDVPDLGKPKKA